jgi:hypothetical protein
MKYKLNRFNNQLINKKLNNNFLHRSNDNININPTSVYSKIKKDYYEFNPKPDVEEIPTFTYENDRNLNTYKGNVATKQAYIDNNSKNYIYYMKRFEKRKTPLISPYAVYQEITKNKLNNYNNNNTINNNTNINNTIDSPNTININKSTNNPITNLKSDWNENYSKNYLHNNKIKEMKPLYTSVSAKEIVLDNRKSEITNPELFYKRNNKDYIKYRAEQKQYLDYNYQILMNKSKLHKKEEPNINPYNPKNEDFEHYKSDLAHNPILNPINYYSYNKYLEKEIKNNGNNRYDNSMNINTNNTNKNNVNTDYINSKRSFSPFQQAGNEVLK